MRKLRVLFLKIIAFFAIALLLSSCRSTYITEAFSDSKIPKKPDYLQEENWAVLPSKNTSKLKDFVAVSDKLEADVFYVYPTLISGKNDIRWNVPTTDEVQNNLVLNKAVHFQASAWATAGNVYVPLYRQAHLRSYSYLEKGGKEALMLAYSDVRAAFQVYLEKYNNGRPIIIASHSQGTSHTRLLLKDFFDDKPLQNKLIAAYLVGIGIPKDEFKTIRVMTKPDETGGFVSWNTYKRNSLPKKYEKWYRGKVTSNPITWDVSKSTLREAHKGFLYSNNKIYTKALKLEIIDGLIWTTLPRFPLRFFAMFKKNYHVGDVNLFWKDIQENAELRVEAWLKNHKI
jgi:hypothetical protein